MKGMLTMSDIKCIKHLREVKDKSISEIQRTLNINWRTAKKYADGDILPKSNIKEKTGMMYESEWGEILACWCHEDSKLRKKTRRTKKELFLELKKLGFPGSYRTVCYFVSEWQDSTENEDLRDKGFDRLEHPEAEAQLDFGTMEVVNDGEYMDAHVLVMSFPYSNASFATVLPGENLECLLEGMKKLFNQAGGVPRRIRIDNLTPAVRKLRSKFEKAKLTDGFLQFQNHYGFETQVCNPRSGNEKGNVENKVGYVRYNFFPTSPIMESFEILSDALHHQLVDDRQRLHYEKEVLIEDLWNHESCELLVLPQEDYPVFKEVEVKSTKYNEIMIDRVRVHVPRAQNFNRLYAVYTWNTVKIVTTQGEILYDDFRPYMNKKRAIDWLGVFKEWRGKLNVVPYSRYWKYLPGRIQAFLNIEDLKMRHDRISLFISLLCTQDLKAINENFYDLIGESKTGDAFEVNWQSYDSLGSVVTANE
jgi:transposase